MRPILPAIALVLFSAGGARAAQPAKVPPGAVADAPAAYYFMLGRHLEDADKIEDAIAAHKKAIELEPKSAELRAELAALYARQDRAREALQMAEAALAAGSGKSRREPCARIDLCRAQRAAPAASSPATTPRSTRRRRSRRLKRAAARPASTSISS
jgi:tetratricopeptide (TPR) repeat protein